MRSWRELEGTVLDGRVGLDRVVSPSPAFSAHLISDHSQSVLVRFLRERSGDELLARCTGASCLSHPNLVRCFGAGLYENGNTRYVYVIFETTEENLAQILQDRSLSPEEVRDLGIQLASGLSYLHERNLICCGLEASTVARSGRFWKIAGYSQLRIAGDKNATKTRGLLTNSPSAPPEAYVGIVSPAWDSWSLGIVLTAALIGPKGEGRDRRAARREFPKSVEAVIAECLTTDPRARCGVERVATLLTERPLHSAKRAPQLAPPNPPLRGTRLRQDATERKRHWTMIAAGAGAVVACALLVAIILNSVRRDAQPRPVPATTTVQKPAPVLPDPSRNAAPPTGDPALATEPSQGPYDSAQIYACLNGWVTASRNRNLEALSSYYAANVNAFYGARHVSREWVKQNREKALIHVGQIRELTIDNVHLRQDRPDHAMAIFDKSWDFGGGYAGKVKQQLELGKLDDNWRIISERNIHVYRVNSGRGRRSPKNSLK
jgi:hypothetical protein